MKTERDLFKQAYLNLRTSGSIPFPDAVFDEYVRLRDSRGYKLVPLELADEIEDKIWDNLSANHTITNQEGDGFIPVEDIDLGGIYKAMIGGEWMKSDYTIIAISIHMIVCVIFMILVSAGVFKWPLKK